VKWVGMHKNTDSSFARLPFLCGFRRIRSVATSPSIVMNARELLQAGKLSSSVAALNEEVKLHPSDVRLRTFLFELLCFSGDYDRAGRQLDVVGHQNESAEIGVEVYRHLLQAEVARRRLFSEGLRPTFLCDPPDYVHLHLSALNRLRENDPQGAKQLLARSESVRPSVKGQLAERVFSHFRDSDDFLAPILEVLSKGAYLWLPLEHVRKITIAPPKFLRDLLWIPATVETREGSTGEVFLPVLYPGSDREDNEQLRLGRMTDWKACGEGLARGVGQRSYVMDDEERAILEIREVELQPIVAST
jgi:type VI secretion system protein ImpE